MGNQSEKRLQQRLHEKLIMQKLRSSWVTARYGQGLTPPFMKYKKYWKQNQTSKNIDTMLELSYYAHTHKSNKIAQSILHKINGVI